MFRRKTKKHVQNDNSDDEYEVGMQHIEARRHNATSPQNYYDHSQFGDVRHEQTNTKKSWKESPINTTHDTYVDEFVHGSTYYDGEKERPKRKFGFGGRRKWSATAPAYPQDSDESVKQLNESSD